MAQEEEVGPSLGVAEGPYLGVVGVGVGEGEQGVGEDHPPGVAGVEGERWERCQ